MRVKNYKMRVAVYETTAGETAIIELGDGVSKMFPKPYVELKRLNDRIGFLPRDNQEKPGVFAIRDDRLQFVNKTNCDKLRDFCGEYDVVNVTDNGVVFIRLQDRRDFTSTQRSRKGEPINGSKHKTKEAPPETIAEKVEPVNDLERTLLAAIDTETAKVKALYERIEELREEIKKAETELREVEKARDIFAEALKIAEVRKKNES